MRAPDSWNGVRAARCGCVSACRPRDRKLPSARFLLPARLDHAGDLSLVAQFAQHDAAQLELAVIAPRPPSELATEPHAYLRAVAGQLRELQRGVEAILHRQ